MNLNISIRNGILLSVLVIGASAKGAVSTCPNNIDPALCDTLQTRGDTDWVFSLISLYAGGAWHDAGCARGDTACLNHQDTSWLQLHRDSILAETDSLFGAHDLRWPDDPKTRASVPTADGRRDTVTYQYHRPSVYYLVYATKGTILSLGSEGYILEIKQWVAPQPLSLSRYKSFNSVPGGGAFNIKGQRIQSPNLPGLWLQKLPESR